MLTRFCDDSPLALSAKDWITCDSAIVEDASLVSAGDLVVAKHSWVSASSFGMAAESFGPDDADVHLPHESLSVHQGSDESKIRNSAFFFDCSGYRISFRLSNDATTDPKTSRRATSTRCLFLPRAETPRAMSPSLSLSKVLKNKKIPHLFYHWKLPSMCLTVSQLLVRSRLRRTFPAVEGPWDPHHHSRYPAPLEGALNRKYLEHLSNYPLKLF